MTGETMEDWRVLTSVCAFVLTLIGFALTRADKSHKKAREIELRTHTNELALSNLRVEIAKEYATKTELAELKNFINGRFDRLEEKLEKTK